MGFCFTSSVDGVIRLSSRVPVAVQFVELRFIENRIGHYILFAGPGAQIEQTAALTAERKILVQLGVRRSFADRTAVLHDGFLSQNPQRRSSCNTLMRSGRGNLTI